MALGKNVEHLRKLAGLTRQAVAKGIGIEGDQAIYALESRDSARSEFAPALAKFFSVDLDALITRDFTELSAEEIRMLAPSSVSVVSNDPDESNITAFSEQAAELLRLFGLASAAGRRTILTSARNAATSNARLAAPTIRNKL
ncbi:helix-turn-helix transcriptional regulator [Herbaspirillum sp. GCM10030257]|uniref:helix-turn-helix transcriptional regulator n=1 Tax=Herbaspirillum sp. GCM10030257 TaxID=3273393 RepID=UPI00361846BC